MKWKLMNIESIETVEMSHPSEVRSNEAPILSLNVLLQVHFNESNFFSSDTNAKKGKREKR